MANLHTVTSLLGVFCILAAGQVCGADMQSVTPTSIGDSITHFREKASVRSPRYVLAVPKDSLPIDIAKESWVGRCILKGNRVPFEEVDDRSFTDAVLADTRIVFMGRTLKPSADSAVALARFEKRGGAVVRFNRYQFKSADVLYRLVRKAAPDAGHPRGARERASSPMKTENGMNMIKSTILAVASATVSLAFAELAPFPEWSEPCAVTQGPHDHLLASYFAIDSWSPDKRYMLVLETDLNGRLPEANERCTHGIARTGARSRSTRCTRGPARST